MKILSLHQQTSLERVQPEAGFGDVAEGGRVVGIHGGELAPSTITADQNNYDPGGSLDLVWQLSSNASRNVTGIAATELPGEIHLLVNVGANPIVLTNESASSTATNRLTCPGAADYTLAAGASVWIEYDGTTTRWRVLGAQIAGAGITGFATPAIALGTAAAAGAAATVIRSDATIVAFDATSPASSAPGDAAAAGSATVAAHRDHRHAREAYGGTGDMSAEAIGSAVAAGSAGKVSDAGHRHAMPSAATPSGGYGTAAAGSAASLLRSDAVLAKPTAGDVDFSADVTTNNVSSTAHGLAPKNPNDATKYLDGTGTYSTPSGGGGGTPTHHGCSVYNAGTQTGSGVRTFNSEDWDTDAYHSTSSNTSRATIPGGLDGYYLCRGYVGFPGANKIVRILKNGSTVRSSNVVEPTGGGECVVVLKLVATDYVEVYTDDTGTTGHASAVEVMSGLTIALLGT